MELVPGETLAERIRRWPILLDEALGIAKQIADGLDGRLGNGFFPGRGLPMELIDVVRNTAREAGRDPAAVEITMGMPDDLAQLPELAAAGISRVLLPVTGVAGLARKVSGPEDLFGWRETIERYAAL